LEDLGRVFIEGVKVHVFATNEPKRVPLKEIHQKAQIFVEISS
jgi:hypothetical protein